jgi:hypothetical protein
MAGSPTVAGTSTTLPVTADGVSTSSVSLHISALRDAALSTARSVAPSQQLRVIGGPSRPSTGAAVSPQNLYSAVQVSGHLPAGTSFDPATFIVSGTPLESGSFSAVFRFTDLVGDTYDFSPGLFIAGTGSSTIQINSFYDLGTASVGSSFSRQLSAAWNCRFA